MAQLTNMKESLLVGLILLTSSAAAYAQEEDILPHANIELFTTDEAYFKGVSLYQEVDGTASLRGRVVRKLKTGKKGGHVSLTLIQGGITFYTRQSGYLGLGHYHNRKRGTFFEIKIPFTPKENTRILIQYYLSR